MNDLPSEVIGIALFGSRARGDQDQDSDVDIVAVVSIDDFKQCEELRTLVSAKVNCDVKQVTVYRRSVFDEMHARGNPFLHHLSREAVLLHDPVDYLRDTLHSVPQFTKYVEHFEIYAGLLRLVNSNCGTAAGLSECDFHLLFMVCRNIAILVSIRNGNPDFGRLSSILRMIAAYPELAHAEKTVRELSRWSIVYKRHGAVPASYPSTATQLEMSYIACEFLKVGKDACI